MNKFTHTTLHYATFTAMQRIDDTHSIHVCIPSLQRFWVMFGQKTIWNANANGVSVITVFPVTFPHARGLHIYHKARSRSKIVKCGALALFSRYDFLVLYSIKRFRNTTGAASSLRVLLRCSVVHVPIGFDNLRRCFYA